MTSIQLSAIIVTFNNEKEIEPCLESLLRELGEFKAEIIVVDNRSTDGTAAKLMTLARDLTSGLVNLETIFNDSNLGFTRALNLGLKKSAGKFLLALNPDTVLQPGSLKTLLDKLRDERNLTVVAPQLLNADGSVQPSCRRFPRRRDVVFEVFGLSHLFPESKFFNSWKMGDFDHRGAADVDQPQGACLLFRRELLEKVGYWDEGFPMFFSDVDWCKRIKAAGYRIFFEPSAKVLHHKGKSIEQDRAEMIWSSHRSFYRYFKKHSRRVGALTELLGLLLLATALLRMAAITLFPKLGNLK